METEGGDVAVAVEGNVLGVGGHERVAGYAVEGSGYLGGDGTEDYEGGDFAFEAAGEVGSGEIGGGGPDGCEV